MHSLQIYITWLNKRVFFFGCGRCAETARLFLRDCFDLQVVYRRESPQCFETKPRPFRRGECAWVRQSLRHMSTNPLLLVRACASEARGWRCHGFFVFLHLCTWLLKLELRVEPEPTLPYRKKLFLAWTDNHWNMMKAQGTLPSKLVKNLLYSYIEWRDIIYGQSNNKLANSIHNFEFQLVFCVVRMCRSGH